MYPEKTEDLRKVTPCSLEKSIRKRQTKKKIQQSLPPFTYWKRKTETYRTVTWRVTWAEANRRKWPSATPCYSIIVYCLLTSPNISQPTIRKHMKIKMITWKRSGAQHPAIVKHGMWATNGSVTSVVTWMRDAHLGYGLIICFFSPKHRESSFISPILGLHKTFINRIRLPMIVFWYFRAVRSKRAQVLC